MTRLFGNMQWLIKLQTIGFWTNFTAMAIKFKQLNYNL